MASLIHMQKILANRMQHFSSVEKAVCMNVLLMYFLLGHLLCIFSNGRILLAIIFAFDLSLSFWSR